VRARIAHLPARLGAPLAIAAGAVVLRLIAGVGFANYDTLYALSWGGQVARGETPQYGIPIAPTPHPLVEVLGVVLSPLSPSAIEGVGVALGFLALSACGWVLYRLGSLWFGRAAGALAALILLTRVPILSYGVRAYVDIPYLLPVLCALLVEARHRRAGVPVLILLALAGLLRPEAWVFSGLYWLYLLDLLPARVLSWLPQRPAGEGPPRGRGELAKLTLLAACGPLLWILSDYVITGQPMWSLTNTTHTASTLDRKSGLHDVPVYIPKRIGEVLQATALAAAAIGAVLSLLWLRSRALPGVVAGVLAVVIFAAFASVGLPIDTRYAFLAAAIGCVFAGAGAFGWTQLPPGDRKRPMWMAIGALIVLGLAASTPSQYRTVHSELTKLARQETFQDDLVALVEDGSITRRCLPVGVPNHAPIPLLALYLGTSPREIVSAEASPITHGTYIDPTSVEVEEDYVLDPHDPHLPVEVPPGFTEAHANSAWFIFERCA